MSDLQGITINTDPAADAHIYAEDDAAVYQSIVGADGVFDIGQKFAATVLSNNKIKIADGVVCIGGHFARIPYGSYKECEIANGQSGYKRNDIIIGKFITTGNGGIDTMTCEVKQGVAGSTASDPAITQGNLYEGALVRELPLYRVRIEGLSIVAVEQLFAVTPTIPALLSKIEDLQRQADALNSKTNYSKNETICGTWHDGRPLYRKVIKTGIWEDNQYFQIPFSNNGLTGCTIVDVKGVCYHEAYTRIIPMAYRSHTADNIGETISIFTTKDSLYLVNRGVIPGEIYLTVEYLK